VLEKIFINNIKKKGLKFVFLKKKKKKITNQRTVGTKMYLNSLKEPAVLMREPAVLWAVI